MNSSATKSGTGPSDSAASASGATAHIGLDAASWRYLSTATLQRFSTNKGTDMAATLTYYTVLAIFPALLAVVSLIKLSGIGATLLPELTQLIARAVPDQGTAASLTEIIAGFFSSAGAGWGLAIGVLTAAWAASGYVAAFARAMNRVYGVGEGRNPIRLKLQQFGLTAMLLTVAVLALLAMVVSGGVAEWVGSVIGTGSVAVTVWDIGKWPVLLAVVIAQVSLLYYWTPNVRFQQFRPLSYGSIVAVLIAILAVTGFSFYAANFGSYDKTYGTLAGAIIGLWLIWLVNVALVFGANLDAEVIRVRQLLRGEPAERELLLKVRDASGIATQTRKADKLAAAGHRIRSQATAS